MHRGIRRRLEARSSGSWGNSRKGVLYAPSPFTKGSKGLHQLLLLCCCMCCYSAAVLLHLLLLCLAISSLRALLLHLLLFLLRVVCREGAVQDLPGGEGTGKRAEISQAKERKANKQGTLPSCRSITLL